MASLDYAYRRLVNTLGPERVARSEFERMVYSHDFASLPKIALLQWKLYPDFVALPQTTEEVAALVKLSDESLLQITPRGGGTGWYGGSVPNRGGVLIDMRKMNHIVAFDPDGRTVTVEAGATWKDLEDFVESKGFALPIVPVNAIGSTVGGAINSGSTGFGAPRGGNLRDAIARLQVVLPDGSLLKTASEADVDGHLANLTPLFFGAEGTLGIITEATIRVVPKIARWPRTMRRWRVGITSSSRGPSVRTARIRRTSPSSPYRDRKTRWPTKSGPSTASRRKRTA